MINYKTGILSKKEKSKILSILETYTDLYSDGYITKNNIRLFLKENPNILFECIRKGDKIAYDETGIAIIIGFSDNASRKYLKILSKDEKVADNLMKRISWDIDCDLWWKGKLNNPIKKVLENNNFKFFNNRGKEVLLVRRIK